ncbi:Glutathione transport system permease protein GsiD [Agrobacterium sp. DSM 25558]|uniref:ABC transporter permease n=1 Tax=Agrobacterium sp. DSM 25558 TaxID=1907665 RepID=UPI0009724DAB|nr:ABC transporter permease [Agrobacterium sp. DSM 25558]SCX29320.1 Glutathione transport system permease protein GsiD [Agrobacterium sp. DSM 25558]
MSLISELPNTSQARTGRVLRAAISRPGLVIASLFLVLVFVATFWPQALTSSDPIMADPLQSQMPPSAAHWFGTDHLGRDVFSRVVHGARYSILIGVSAVAVAAIFGSLLGILAGLIRGVVDEVITRALDVVSSFPDLLLALVLISFTGPGTVNLIFALGIASVPRFARMVRAQTFVIAKSGYLEQAKTFGLTPGVLVLRHILPHAIAQVPILATIGLGTTIIQASGLSFLGMGPQPPAPEWGAMLAEARNYLRVAWWIGVWPGIAITLTVISISVVGRHWQAAFDGRRQA